MTNSLIFRDLLQCFSVAYQNKVLAVPLDWLHNITFYESIHQLTTDLKYYGLIVDAETKSVKFLKDSFQSSKTTVSEFKSKSSTKLKLSQLFLAI